jgi:CubicO group peptidase (beta-lactamase class C family)
MTREVWQSARVGPGAFDTLRTVENGWQGQALGGYGLWWIPDDVAKLTQLMHDQGRTPDGVQLLHPELAASAMQRDPGRRGLLTGIGDRYRLGFWARRYSSQQDAAFTCDFWVPYMSGAGGIVILLLPNGMTYFYFSDGGEFQWLDVVRELYRLRPMCSQAH